MTTLIRRKIDGLHSPKMFKTNSELILRTNKSKNLNWWRVLNAKKMLQCSKPHCVPVPEKVCDQVRLDVERAFCFDSGFPSKKYSWFNVFIFLEVDIMGKREKLYKIIISVLERNPSFKYYQVKAVFEFS